MSSTAFLLLSEDDQKDALAMAESKLNLSAKILEKDVWICWVLRELFLMPDHLPMVFKGGTSLSKVFNVIARISEDIDLTLDCTGEFGAPADTGSQRRKQREQIEAFVETYIRDKVSPHLQASADQSFGKDRVRLVQDKGNLLIQYPTVTGTADYLLESILLEFGGRNKIEPNLTHNVTPYMMALPELFKIEFPTAKVLVLSGQRTFWEKVTLLHDELCRDEIRPNASRLFRHWYDVARMADHEIGRTAGANKVLCDDVIETKTLLYSGSHSKYELCSKGQFKIVPEGSHLTALESDYKAMISAGMFFVQPPRFEDVINRIQELQNQLNGTKTVSSEIKLKPTAKEVQRIAAETRAKKKRTSDPLSISETLKAMGSDHDLMWSPSQFSKDQSLNSVKSIHARLTKICESHELPAGNTDEMLSTLRDAGWLADEGLEILQAAAIKLARGAVTDDKPYKDDLDITATDEILFALLNDQSE